MRSLVLVALVAASPAIAQTISIDPPESVSRKEGLAAWDRIYEVASHPRCGHALRAQEQCSRQSHGHNGD